MPLRTSSNSLGNGVGVDKFQADTSTESLMAAAAADDDECCRIPVVEDPTLTCHQVHQIYTRLKVTNFDLNQVVSLETSQLLERCLWRRFLPTPDFPGSQETERWGFLSEEEMEEEKEEKDSGARMVGHHHHRQSVDSLMAEPNVQRGSDPGSEPAAVVTFTLQGETKEGDSVKPVHTPRQRLRYMKSWVLLTACLINEKVRQRIDPWASLGLDADSSRKGGQEESLKFRLFFYLSWFIFLQPDKFRVSMTERAGLIQLFICVYQALEQDAVRRSCMQLCGIPLWMHLGAKQLEQLFRGRPELRLLFRVVKKRYQKVTKRCGVGAMFDSKENSPNTILLSDRFSLLDRDALYDSVCQFIRVVESDLPKKINVTNLSSLDVMNEAEQFFFTTTTSLQRPNAQRPVRASNSLGTRPEKKDRETVSSDPEGVHGNYQHYQPESQLDQAVRVRNAGVVEQRNVKASVECQNENPLDVDSDDFLYCERFLEFLIDMVSQLPTRRVLLPVLQSLQLIPRLRLSLLIRHNEANLIRHLTEILAGYESFEIDDATGLPLDNQSIEGRNYEELKRLQLVFFEHFQHMPKLKEAALGPISAFREPSALRVLFSELDVTVLLQIADALNLVDALQFAKTTVLDFLLVPGSGKGGRNKLQSLPSAVHPTSMVETEEQQYSVPGSPAIDFIESHQGSEDYQAAHRLMVEVLVNSLKKRQNQLTLINRLPLYPPETLLWDPSFVPTEHFQGDLSLALPKLNLQFLTIRDYLLRNFHLFRLESSYEIREDLEDSVYRMKPSLVSVSSNTEFTKSGAGVMSQTYASQSRMETQFRGASRMACPIDRFAVILVKPPALGSDVPDEVRAEIVVDLRKVPKEFRKDWDSSLRQFDVLFLLAIAAPVVPFQGRPQDLSSVEEFPEKFGVLGVRGCEVVEVLDEEGISISETAGGEQQQKREPFGDLRTYRVLLDPYQYQMDLNELTGEATVIREGEESALDIYSALNLLVRRKPAENNFKAILQTIRQLMNDTEHTVIPAWLHDLFLGYGDPHSAQYFNLPTELQAIDFVDTFLDERHAIESFPHATTRIQPMEDAVDGRDPTLDSHAWTSPSTFTSPSLLSQPFCCRLQFQQPSAPNADSGSDNPPCRSESMEPPPPPPPSPHHHHQGEGIIVQPYRGKCRGPQCEVRRNRIRFTPLQVDGIRSGVNPGLTLIVGPPGTGKTDTAVQIVNLLYKNFPDQRILMVAHSNQALNDLFEKIAALDIDERYLLRLGMGEKELRIATDRSVSVAGTKDFSKWGRVNYMLQRRLECLSIVERLGQTLRVVGDFGASCEVAIQFYRFHIVHRIQRYRRQLEEVGRTGHRLRLVLRDMRIQDGHQARTGSRLVESEQRVGRGAAEEKRESKIVQRRKSRGEEEEEEEDEMKGQPPPEDEEMNTVSVSEGDEKKKEAALKAFDEVDDLNCIAFKEGRVSVIEVLFPFTAFFSSVVSGESLFPNVTTETFSASNRYDRDVEISEGCFRYLSSLFKEVEECRAFELLRSLYDRGNYLLTRHAKIIAMTCTHAALVRKQMVDMRLRYDTLIMEEAAQVLEVETFVPMVLQKTEPGGVSRLKRVVLIGDHNQLPPVVKNRGFQQYGRLDQSMFTRFIRLQVPFIQLDRQSRCRTTIRELFSWRYTRPPLTDLPAIYTTDEYRLANIGFSYDYQFINVDDFEGVGESCPLPHFYQNRGEAEFAVALFMYMRLLGYPAEKIVILTTYNGQKELLKSVIQQRCGWNPALGWPAVVSTVDKFQGQQSDYVILSLVRTRTVGHLRDVRRLVVALSRARLGLYVFGRMKLFGRCLELDQTFQFFKRRPILLALNVDEQSVYMPSGRPVLSTGPVTLVDSVYGMWERVQQKALQALSQLQQPPSRS